MGNTFYSNLPPSLIVGDDPVERRLLEEYGAVFAAQGVDPPPKIVFKDQAEVEMFQADLDTSSAELGEFTIELQAAAMEALLVAAGQASERGYCIAPRGSDSAKRTYDETVGLWKSRVEPALVHWVKEGRLPAGDTARIAAMSPFEQVAEVLRLEEDGIYFAKDLSKSILYSVAPPGTSQHLSMLAIDVREFDDKNVRTILAENGWYQTVVSDLPHFTFLGTDEAKLPALGLKRVLSGDRHFWIPDI